MKAVMVIFLSCGIAFAGVRVGGRIGYYDGDDPRTGQSASSVLLGGQVVIPFMGIVQLEVSGTYSSSESDITLQNYLTSYIEEEFGVNFENDSLGLFNYLEQEWGWSPDNITDQMIAEYRATFYDIGIGTTLKVVIPVGAIPLRPYIGGGGGARIIFSDADILIQVVNEQTGGSVSIDPYDHVHPEMHVVLGLSFDPPVIPLSIFGEYKYTRPIGSNGNLDPFSMYYAGVNLGF